MTTDKPGIHIGGGVYGGAVAAGDNARAVVNHGADTSRDQAVQELLAAVRELRADLTRVRQTDATTALDTALAETEQEIVTTGRAEPTRRERLRQLLDDSQALVGLLASAGALAGLVGS